MPVIKFFWQWRISSVLMLFHRMQKGTNSSSCCQGMLTAFVEYIKDRKTVVLEDLAAHFNLRVQVCTSFHQVSCFPWKNKQRLRSLPADI